MTSGNGSSHEAPPPPPDLLRADGAEDDGADDDGAADHLPGAAIPHVVLTDTDGQHVDLAALAGRSVVHACPRAGRPGEEPPVDDPGTIPGAGDTPPGCGFRDHHGDLTDLGVRVFGLSTQSTAHQRETVERLHLPFPLLSDEHHELMLALRLPTLEVAGQRLLRRITLLVRDGHVERTWRPVVPPAAHAGEVVSWLRRHPEPARGAVTR